ncbi:MAG: hypothetical protein FWJ74_09275 [Gemmatimonadota bacterium]
MSRPRHLLAVWNPSYADDPMDAHIRVLLHWVERRRRGEAGEEDVYVWWARIRSPNRRDDLPHLPDVLALQQQIDDGVETHLYLTDYRSLYVGLLDEITGDDVLREWPDEADHMPAYYRGQRVDVWFRLLDIRRIVADDTLAVIEELRKLRNVHYHDRPVSLYGGMTNLPLVLTRDEEVRWFRDTATLLDGRLWVERDAANRSETERMARELRDNLIGPELWAVLEPATRTFLASAEADYRPRREDPAFDFSGPAIELAKAVETELNAILFRGTRRALRSKPPRERETRVDGRLVDLGDIACHLPLGAIRHLLERDELMQRAVRAAFPHDANWILGQLPHHLAPLVELRNPAAHSAALDRERAARQRAAILGIGCEGLIVQLARVKLRAG